MSAPDGPNESSSGPAPLSSPQEVRVLRHIAQPMRAHVDIEPDSRSSNLAILDRLPQSVAFLVPPGTILDTNPSWERERRRSSGTSLIEGAAPGTDFVELCRRTGGELASAGGHVADGVARLLDGRADRFEVEYVVDGGSDDLDSGQSNLLIATAVDPATTSGAAALVTHQDTTTHHRVQRAFTEMAFTDPLTGLPNRPLVLDRLRMLVRRADRSQAGAAVIFVDLDRFKAVNDDHGHAVGDQVLREVARRLRRSVRAEDTCGRWGGDEFVLVVELTDGDDLGALVERTRATTHEPVRLPSGDVTIGMSIGVAVADGSATVDQLLRQADQAMYRAKRAGDHVPVAAST